MYQILKPTFQHVSKKNLHFIYINGTMNTLLRQLIKLVNKISTEKIQCCKTLAWQNPHHIKSDPALSYSRTHTDSSKTCFLYIYRVSEISWELISEFPVNRRKNLRLFLLKQCHKRGKGKEIFFSIL